MSKDAELYIYKCSHNCENDQCYFLLERKDYPGEAPTVPGRTFCPYNRTANWRLQGDKL